MWNMPLEPQGRQGGTYLGHIPERWVIKIRALKNQLQDCEHTLMHMHGANITHTQ